MTRLQNVDVTEAVGTATIKDDATVLESDATVLDREAVPNAIEVIIEKGALLLDTYRVESDAIQGGMGKVWRVRHTGWNADLAMKQPKAELFRNERQKSDFIHECEAWIKLGLHPQIASCYYVREINGIPSIFAEWMDGGSLKGWINSGRLYEGDARLGLERVLDIAIQFGRGLHYAHEQGLIHQDVKPDNLLLTPEGGAKVADFGIARARALLAAQDTDLPADATLVSASGAYTPAYCSPEQINGETLTRRTDIYSWAVSVLEMFLGER
ncbi:MAG: serine/threonine protein kinase, partial [Candidatus Accumulibacter sp.]|nr:serine/threonine protein kinase [Accumulibacter sp.]